MKRERERERLIKYLLVHLNNLMMLNHFDQLISLDFLMVVIQYVLNVVLMVILKLLNHNQLYYHHQFQLLFFYHFVYNFQLKQHLSKHYQHLESILLCPLN
jgi:hypothetical protein